MSLVIFCLLFSSVDYVPVKGEIIWMELESIMLSEVNSFLIYTVLWVYTDLGFPASLVETKAERIDILIS